VTVAVDPQLGQAGGDVAAGEDRDGLDEESFNRPFQVVLW
jgi:hypothetical protein